MPSSSTGGSTEMQGGLIFFFLRAPKAGSASGARAFTSLASGWPSPPPCSPEDRLCSSVWLGWSRKPWESTLYSLRRSGSPPPTPRAAGEAEGLRAELVIWLTSSSAGSGVSASSPPGAGGLLEAQRCPKVCLRVRMLLGRGDRGGDRMEVPRDTCLTGVFPPGSPQPGPLSLGLSTCPSSESVSMASCKEGHGSR